MVMAILIPLGSLMAGNTPAPVAGVRSDYVQQQPDPKKKELAASVTRSAENELLSLHAFFPDDADKIRVALYNILGKMVELHPITSVEKGDRLFQFQTRGLPSGPYIVVLESKGQRIVNKVMVSR
jgi:Secretion system C-terminal sorting domain